MKENKKEVLPSFYKHHVRENGVLMLHLPTIITSLQSVSSYEVTLTAGMQSAAANLQHNQEPHITMDIDQSFQTPKLGSFMSYFHLKPQ